MQIGELAIELVRNAYRAYLLNNNISVFRNSMIDDNAPLVLYESKWIGDCEIASEEYRIVTENDNIYVVQGKVVFFNKEFEIYSTRSTVITVVCSKKNDAIKFEAVHNSGTRKKVIVDKNYVDKDTYYRTVMETLCDVVMEVDMEKNEIYYDKDKYRALFWEAPDFKLMDDWFWHICNNFVNKNDAEKLDIFRSVDLAKRFKSHNYIIETKFRINRGEEEVWVHLRVVFVPDMDMIAVARVFILLDDITLEMIEKMQNIEFARRDSLTNLWNRRYTEEQIVKKIKENGKGIFLIVDVDNFKDVNDTFGHITGDTILRIVSSNMLTAIHEDEVLGRFGGDEFILYLNSTGDFDADMKHIDEVVGSTRFRHNESDVSMNIHCSAGVVFFDNPNVTFDQLYDEADKTMYEAKEGGRDAVNVIRI